MKLRPVQLVCLALLLSTLRLADPAALPPDDLALRVGVLQVLLRTELAGEAAQPRPRTLPGRLPAPAAHVPRAAAALPPEAAIALQARWSMPPPARQSAAVQSFTGFLRA